MRNSIEILCDSAHGQYIPQIMTTLLHGAGWQHITDENVAIANAGPDHEWYWENWNNILTNATFTDPNTGDEWSLHQDGDLFAVCVARMSPEENEAFMWD